MAHEYAGGKCAICGYKKSSRAFSFHHRDPKKKDFGIAANGMIRSWEKTRKEIENVFFFAQIVTWKYTTA